MYLVDQLLIDNQSIIVPNLSIASENEIFEEDVIPFYSLLVAESPQNELFRTLQIGLPNTANDNLSVTGQADHFDIELGDESNIHSITYSSDSASKSTDSKGVGKTENRGDFVALTQTSSSLENRIVKNTAHVIQTEVFTNSQSTQSITVRLTPENLGTLQIQVDIYPEQVSAHILASELQTADLLGRGKGTLEELLTGFGFEGASVDVSHGSLSQEFGSNESENNETENDEIDPSSQEILAVNTTVELFVGLDLVA